MKVFYYCWHENSARDMAEALMCLGCDVYQNHIPFSDYENDEEFIRTVEKQVVENACDIFLSFDFFPLLAKLAEKMQKRYISWIYDCPHNTLYSPSIRSEYVSLFVFDKKQYYLMQAIKGGHVHHMPLAVNAERLNSMLGIDWKNVNYVYDVSFVGSLYENNLYQRVKYLPEYIRGYVQGIIEAQKRVYGYNLIQEVLDQNVLAEMKKYIKMSLPESYLMDDSQLFIDMINAEVTHQERMESLKIVTGYFDVKLFTASHSDALPSNIFAGIVSYDREMPKVFRESKINLNFTLRSIESGIPLRVLDVLGAGGFLLTNYQPEIAEYFVNGEEVVMFESKEDMLEKIAYYLEHEEERKQIAYNGWLKVQKEFTYQKQLAEILDLAEKDNGK